MFTWTVGPNRVSPSSHLKMRIDPVPKTLCFLVVWSSGRWAISRNPVILSVIHHGRNHLGSTIKLHTTNVLIINKLTVCLKQRHGWDGSYAASLQIIRFTNDTRTFITVLMRGMFSIAVRYVEYIKVWCFSQHIETCWVFWAGEGLYLPASNCQTPTGPQSEVLHLSDIHDSLFNIRTLAYLKADRA
jgi:hypothetical protein